jgi:hypothetical protein
VNDISFLRPLQCHAYLFSRGLGSLVSSSCHLELIRQENQRINRLGEREVSERRESIDQGSVPINQHMVVQPPQTSLTACSTCKLLNHHDHIISECVFSLLILQFGRIGIALYVRSQ